jgi:ribosome maturation factor RimP
MGGFIQPIFFAAGETGLRASVWSARAHGEKVISTLGSTLPWQEAIARTVGAIGYELVDAERSAGGLLRVFIERVAGRTYESGEGEAVTVADCERVTRELQYALDVDGIDYARLEVSSPGLDRPLRKPADWQRFAGSEVDLTLRAPFQGRKRWRGLLQPRDAGWRLVLPRETGVASEALDFDLNEVREARLVPQLDFKGRHARPAA